MYFFHQWFFLNKKEHLQSFYVFSLTMSIMGLTNTNLFKFPIYSFLAFICVYYANNYQKKLMKIGIIGTRGIPNYHGGFEQFAEFFLFMQLKKVTMFTLIIQ